MSQDSRSSDCVVLPSPPHDFADLTGDSQPEPAATEPGGAPQDAAGQASTPTKRAAADVILVSSDDEAPALSPAKAAKTAAGEGGSAGGKAASQSAMSSALLAALGCVSLCSGTCVVLVKH